MTHYEIILPFSSYKYDLGCHNYDCLFIIKIYVMYMKA